MRSKLKRTGSEKPKDTPKAEPNKKSADCSGAGSWIAQNARVLFLFVGFEIILLFVYEILFIKPLDIERLLLLTIPLFIIAMMRHLAKDSAKTGLVNKYHIWSSVLFIVTAFVIGHAYGGSGDNAIVVAFCLSALAFLAGHSFYFWHWYGINIVGLFSVAWITLGDWYLLPENRPLLFQSAAVLFISSVYCKSRVHEFKEQIDKSSAWADHKQKLQAAVSTAEECTHRFQKIYEGSFEGIVLHKSGYIYDCNPALLEIFKLTKENILNQSILKLLNQGGNNELLNSILTSQSEASEIKTTSRDGEVLYLEVLSKIIHSEDGDTYATALRNITARKSAEQSIVAKNKVLEKQFNRQKALAEWSPVLDKIQDIQETSGVILRYLHDLLPATGGVFFGIRSPYNGAWRVFVARNGNLEPEAWSSEKNRPYRDLAEKICQGNLTITRAPEELGVQKRAFAAIPLDLSHGQQGFIMAQDMNLTQYSNQDIDFLVAVASRFSLGLDNSKMLEDLVEAKDAAEAGSRAKSQFLATLSHELRTPLNGIIGSCQILGPVLEDPADQATLMAVRNSSEAMTNMVDRILSFTQIAGDGVDLKSAEFSIETLISDVKDSLESLSEAKGLPFDFKVNPGVPPDWNSDFHSCKTIILNLTENALKFTEKGGVRVQISVVNQPGGSSRSLLFEVYDSGCGFDKEKVDELFQPFSQSDGSHSRKHGGLGLGLAVCKALVQRLGGRIGGKPTNQGSLFWVEIPEGIRSSGSTGDMEDVFAKIGANKNRSPNLKPTDVHENQPKEAFNPAGSFNLGSGQESGNIETKKSGLQERVRSLPLSDDPLDFRTLIVESSPFIRMALMKYFEKDGIIADFVKGLQEVVPKFALSNSKGIVYTSVIVSEKQDFSEVSKIREKLEKLKLRQKPEFKRMSRTTDGQTGERASGIQLEEIQEIISH